MTNTEKVIGVTIFVFFIALIWVWGTSTMPVHYTCDDNGNRQDFNGFQSRWDNALNKYTITQFVLHEEGSPDERWGGRLELNRECIKWKTII